MVQTAATKEPDGSGLLWMRSAVCDHRHPVLLLFPAPQLQLVRQMHIQLAADRPAGDVSTLHYGWRSEPDS